MVALLFIVSIGLLVYSAGLLVDCAVQLAKSFRLSKAVIGLTIVAVGTSLPELSASLAGAIENHPDIAMGNVIGSNICNIALIVGLPALFFTVRCTRNLFLHEGVVMIFASATVWALALVYDGIPRTAGFLLVLAFVVFLVQLVQAKGDEQEEDAAPGKSGSLLRLALKSTFSLGLLLLSSHFVVHGAVGLAQALGVSENVIALTLIALGTSLPELSVSIAAGKRGQTDILIGNIIGSNIANLLLIAGISAAVRPLPVNPASILFDLPAMVLLAVLLMLFLVRKHGVTRLHGLFFLLCYGLVICRALYLR